MYSLNNNLLVLVILLVLAGGILMMSVGTGEVEQNAQWQAPQFEFTLWTDTLDNNRFANVPVVHISDQEAARASMLVLQNQRELLPVRKLHDKVFGLLMIGKPVPVFEAYLRRYTRLDTVIWVEKCRDYSSSVFQDCSHIMVSVSHSLESSQDLKMLLQRIESERRAILVCFDTPDLLVAISDHHSLVLAPGSFQASQEFAAQLLFGGQEATRGIPPDLGGDTGFSRSYSIPKIRMGYIDPEYVGMSSDTLAQIDQIIQEAIASYALPGCQVLVARQGQVVYHKSFGYHTYRRQAPVRLDDLYDVASITKIAGTTLASMKMVEEGKISLTDQIGDYLRDHEYETKEGIVTDTLTENQWKDLLESDSMLSGREVHPWNDSLLLYPRMVRKGKRKNRSKIFTLRLGELLTHTSGLRAGLNVYPYQQQLGSGMYHSECNDQFSVPVASDFFLDHQYLDSLWNDTKALNPDSGGYRYSCINMILLQRVLDSVNQENISVFLDREFYQRLGLQTLGYMPLGRVASGRIAPTTVDRWRGQLLCGTVHDPTAALFGGVSGNSGLFSNAHDLGILGQMWLNGGSYGGQQYLAEETVALFTKRTRGHRGLGFDMAPRAGAYLMAESASLHTYGHTGFTGTCMWVDPVHDLVFIFLSNRIHPSQDNNRINDMRVRQRVHQVVYDALGVPADPLRIPEVPPVKPERRSQVAVRQIVFAP